MPFLLDTNICIGILTGRSPKAIEKLHQLAPTEVRICSAVRAELQFGARNSSRVEANLSLLETFHTSDDSTEIEFRIRYRAFVDAFCAGALRLRERARELGEMFPLLAFAANSRLTAALA